MNTREACDKEAREIVKRACLKFEDENNLLTIEISTAIRKRAEAILFLRNEYSRFGSRGCPACEYQDGKFIKLCKLHEEIQALESQIKTLTEQHEAEKRRIAETAKQVLIAFEIDWKEQVKTLTDENEKLVSGGNK